MTAAEIVAALRGRSGRARCPVHGGSRFSLCVDDGDSGRILVRCHAGCSQAAVIRALTDLGLWPRRDAPEPTEAEREAQRRRDKRRQDELLRRAIFITRLWQQTWREARPAADSPEIACWLGETRGIDVAAPDLHRLEALRWHPQCPLGRERVPAMVALMTDTVTNEPSGIHRTYLKRDGSAKADVPEPRMMLGNAGVIRLSRDEDVERGLGITEGIETGLAVTANCRWRPIWACGSLDMLKSFPVLNGIECLTVFADSKPNEIAGARECAERWVKSGREAEVKMTGGAGDFNDVLIRAAS
jgi:hypothetical protein